MSSYFFENINKSTFLAIFFRSKDFPRFSKILNSFLFYLNERRYRWTLLNVLIFFYQWCRVKHPKQNRKHRSTFVSVPGSHRNRQITGSERSRCIPTQRKRTMCVRGSGSGKSLLNSTVSVQENERYAVKNNTECYYSVAGWDCSRLKSKTNACR